MEKQVIVVDYKTSNIRSVANMLRKVEAAATVTSDPDLIRKGKKIILPGIGAFDVAVKNLRSLGLIDALNEAVLEKKVPVLGICLGMQLFAEGSEEGVLPGLGWIPGYVRRFGFGAQEFNLPIPHMGWNYVRLAQESSPLFQNVPKPIRFYFVHSYHFVCESSENVLGVTRYGYDFASAVFKENIWGVQFHPEKSHKYGMQLLKNFVERI